ncbi:MAG TPA: YbhB/YbcL family Raf kinase inhibitor-like protein, partial [Thermoprotei archaeon]|nr:YbhB/YbcL family Raf kinase inhibitor-like protein [Thermoprotei archaeon]
MRFFRGGPSKEEVIDSLFKYPEILDVTSTAFEAEGRIPVKYTCDGEDINPEIRWSQPPENTASLMIIMYDPDAPIGYFIHWV